VSTSSMGGKLDGLTTAVDAAKGHLDDELISDAAAITAHGAERLKRSGQHTIVALAGATGSGKSSLFNAISDLELAGTGVRRPTTSWALACAWGPDGASELLEWMGIPTRHQVSRMGMLDRSSEDTRLDGLVLLDLPDHDSTEVSHHVEMERLVPYSDLMVWVLDPQKYADAAIHERYIRPMAAQADSMVVVLNQIDLVPFEQRAHAIDDLRRVMSQAGLGQVPVLAVSATRGDGIDEFKRLLASRIRERTASRTRLDSQVDERARALADAAGVAEVPGISEPDSRALKSELEHAVGIDDVTQAVTRSDVRRGRTWVAWLPWAWRLRSRTDQMSELTGGRLDREDMETAGQTRLSVHVAGAEQAIRTLVKSATSGLKQPWAAAVRRSCDERRIVDKLSHAVAGVDGTGTRVPAWWFIAALVQWLLFVAFLAGVVWSVLDLTGVTSSPRYLGQRASWGLGIIGLAGGILAALIGSIALRITARRRARRIGDHVRDAVASIADDDVLRPIGEVLEDYSTFRSGMRTALAGGDTSGGDMSDAVSQSEAHHQQSDQPSDQQSDQQAGSGRSSGSTV